MRADLAERQAEMRNKAQFERKPPQAVMRERFKSGLPDRIRIRNVGTVCSNCRTAFVAHPVKENNGLCGWCKVKAMRQLQ